MALGLIGFPIAAAMAWAADKYKKNQDDTATQNYQGLLQQDMEQQGINPAMGRFEGQPVPTPYTDAGNMTPAYQPSTGFALKAGADPRYQPITDRLLQEQGAMGRTGLTNTGAMDRQIQGQQYDQGVENNAIAKFKEIQQAYGEADNSPAKRAAIASIPGAGGVKLIQDWMKQSSDLYGDKEKIDYENVAGATKPITPYQQADLNVKKVEAFDRNRVLKANFDYQDRERKIKQENDAFTSYNELQRTQDELNSLKGVFTPSHMKAASSLLVAAGAVRPGSPEASMVFDLQQTEEKLAFAHLNSMPGPKTQQDYEASKRATKFYDPKLSVADNTAKLQQKLNMIENRLKNAKNKHKINYPESRYEVFEGPESLEEIYKNGWE